MVETKSMSANIRRSSLRPPSTASNREGCRSNTPDSAQRRFVLGPSRGVQKVVPVPRPFSFPVQKGLPDVKSCNKQYSHIYPTVVTALPPSAVVAWPLPAIAAPKSSLRPDQTPSCSQTLTTTLLPRTWIMLSGGALSNAILWMLEKRGNSSS